MRRVVLVCLALALVGAPLGAPQAAGQAKRTEYEPPYKKGPQGGDVWNYIHSDPQSGEIGILRTFPGIPPVVGCAPEPSAGWAMFRLKHRVTQPVKSVAVSFEGALDPYAWVTVGIRNERGRWLGIRKFQGPHTGAGSVRVRLFERPTVGSRMTVEFGLQLGDACPQVGGAVASFPSVRVRP